MKTEYLKEKYSVVIAIQEKSAGNSEVGDMWLETKSFPDNTPVREIMEWAQSCSGKLTITWDESTKFKQKEGQ